MVKGILVSFFAFILAFNLTVHAQTTGFTYQGSLKDGSTPSNGNHDFEFLLFDTLSGGSQVGGTIALTNVGVTDGLFSVKLDFGSQFPGANRFLEIRVRRSGQPSFNTLAPRQPINSTPYAVKSLSAENSTNATQLGGIAAGQYVITTDPRMSDARNPLPNSTNYIRNSADRQVSSNFNISGDGTAGGMLSGETVNSATQFNIAGQRVFSVVGLGNTFAGLNTGISGRSNSFFGTSAGAATTTGETNSFYGHVAGTSTTTGDANSFFGASAGRLNTTGQLNAFFGYRAGELSVTSSDNSFFGAFSGAVNTTGNNNSFFGRSSGAANTTGAGNSFFGRNAGNVNTTGSANSFFGRSAGGLNIDGGFNSFFGYGAGQSNTDGNNNTFFGRESGFLNTTADDNSFFGSEAGISSTGFVNSFFGRAAGMANTTGTANSFFGAFAGSSSTTGTGNTFVGRNAGNSNTTGDQNTVIGYLADVSPGNLSFATAIGAQATVSASNTIQLGRINGSDTVIVSGILRVGELGNAGATALCRNNANGIATCSSSIRYKWNINPFSSGIGLIQRLRPISFTWKEGQTLDLGLTAEEVAEVEPLLVTHNSKGEVEGVKYDRIGVVLINAVQEQQVQIEAQSRELAEQKEINQKLQRRLDMLTRFVCGSHPTSEVCMEEK